MDFDPPQRQSPPESIMARGLTALSVSNYKQRKGGENLVVTGSQGQLTTEKHTEEPELKKKAFLSE